MKQLKEISFRELDNQYVFIISDGFNSLLAKYFTLKDSINGFLAYCFIDHYQGMGLEILDVGAFNETNNTLKLNKENIEASIRIYPSMYEETDILLNLAAGGAENCQNIEEADNLPSEVNSSAQLFDELKILQLSASTPYFSVFADKLAKLKQEIQCNENIAATRKVANLDPCRLAYRPDDIIVKLVKGEILEDCVVRVEGIEQLGFYGELLTEPNPVYDLHRGENISFLNVRNSLGIMCIKVLE